MKVCLVSRETQGGGIGTYTWNLARGLQACNCEVTVVGIGREFRKERVNGIEAICLPNRKPQRYRIFPPFSELRKWKKELGIAYPYKFASSLSVGWPVGDPDGMVPRPTRIVDWYENGIRRQID